MLEQTTDRETKVKMRNIRSFSQDETIKRSSGRGGYWVAYGLDKTFVRSRGPVDRRYRGLLLPIPTVRAVAVLLAIAAILAVCADVAAQTVPLVALPVQPSRELSERAERVAEAFRERRARPLRERWTGFLREGRSQVFTVTVARPQCVGFVVVGREGLDDIDLAVSNQSGAELARDDRRDAHPYVRVCLSSPGTLHVRVTGARGNGEATALTFVDAPLVPPPLDDVLGVRPASLFGGPRVARTEVGRDPAALSAHEHLARLTARLVDLGYRRTGISRSGQLLHGQTRQNPVLLTAGRCYVIQGAGGDHVDDLDLRVLGPDGRSLGQDVASDARPVVRVCPTIEGTHSIDLRMFAGAGEWAFEVLQVPPEVRQQLGDDVSGGIRARALELALEAGRRHMVPMREAIRGGAWLGGTIPFGVWLRAGRCYLFGAAADEAPGLLDVWLAGRDGAVLSADTNERERAMVYHCARRDQRATVNVRVQGGRGEFVYQAFESEP